MNNIAVALITLAGVLATAAASIITQAILSKQSQEKMLAEIKHQSELDDAKMDARLSQHQAVTDVKIDELTREVREHNNFAKRMPVIEEKIEVANHRIADLEKLQSLIINDGK